MREIKAYYNELDPYPVQWLMNLSAAGRITGGLIDTRSITELKGTDLIGFDRVHLFAGIAGWELALELAGWPLDLPVWTGSCPCQPFSIAGKRKGTSDERHLWPEMRRLIDECRPDVVFGEQVASSDGREWLAGVQTDLEAMGFAFGAADLCAAGVGAPHIRQRLYWAGYNPEGLDYSAGARRNSKRKRPEVETWDETRLRRSQQGCDADGVAYTQRPDRNTRRSTGQSSKGNGTSATESHSKSGRRGDSGRLGHHHHPRLEGRVGSGVPERGDQLTPWASSSLVACLDGKTRRVPNPESGIQPLAHGVSARMGKLRAIGNAIVPQVGTQFIKVFMETVGLC